MTNDVRTIKEKLIDNLILLYIINKTNSIGKMDGATKLQKIIFLIEFKLNEDRIKGVNYTFFKSHYGPFDWYLSKDVDKLTEENVLKEENGIKLTEEGKEILKDSKELLLENSSILKIIDSIIKKYAKFKLSQIIKVVYNMAILQNGSMVKIKDIPEQKLILRRLKDKEIRNSFKIEGGWVETLDLYFDRDAFKSIKNAMEGVRTNGTIPMIKNASSV